jgi:hypothetical protein
MKVADDENPYMVHLRSGRQRERAHDNGDVEKDLTVYLRRVAGLVYSQVFLHKA